MGNAVNRRKERNLITRRSEECGRGGVAAIRYSTDRFKLLFLKEYLQRGWVLNDWRNTADGPSPAHLRDVRRVSGRFTRAEDAR